MFIRSLFAVALSFSFSAGNAQAQYVEAAQKIYGFYSEGQSQAELLNAINEVSDQIEAAKNQIISTMYSKIRG